MRIFEELEDGKNRGLIRISTAEVVRQGARNTRSLHRYLADEAKLAGLVPETCEVRETPWLPFAYVIVGEIAPQFSPGD